MTVVTHRRLHTGSGEDFGPRADGFVAGHTWEGKTLTVGTVEQFLKPGGPADWQDADHILGSYNLVICSDGVVETVQWDHASGGINPGSSGFNPRAWLYGVADRDEIFNPNYFSLQLCFFVSLAYCDANGWPPYMIDAAARAWIEEEQRTGRKMTWTQHADFQPPPNRFDCGDTATRLVKARYAELTDMYEWVSNARPTDPFRATIGKGAYIRKGPAIGPETFDYEASADVPVVVIASVRGDPFMDSRTWYVFATDAGLRVVHSRNQVGSRVPLERTIEVPTGISPESWAALQKQASTALRTLSVSAVTEADAIDAKKP
jgi:hypothetical protein